MAENVRNILLRAEAGGTVCLEGWLRTARHAKEVSFLALSDGSCFEPIQIVVGPGVAEFEGVVRKLGNGCAVRVVGALVASPGRGQSLEVHASSVELVGGVDDDYPLQKKRHGFEYLRTIAHLRPRTNTFGAVLRVRNAAARAIHEFFQERGFVWLHSPIVTLSDAEGAGQMFRVTSLSAEEPPRGEDGRVDFGRDFFGAEAHITVSGQLEAEIGALALSRVYTFGPTFRVEDSNTSRHLAEFWMVEPEMAFCDLAGDVELAEAFLKHVLGAVLEACPDDLEFFEKRIARGLLDMLRHVVESPFERLSYDEAPSSRRAGGSSSSRWAGAWISRASTSAT